jgi:hypothetical protein
MAAPLTIDNGQLTVDNAGAAAWRFPLSRRAHPPLSIIVVYRRLLFFLFSPFTEAYFFGKIIPRVVAPGA